MYGKGAWSDNVFAERVWRTIKYQRVYLRACDDVSAAKADIAHFIDRYNTEQQHSSQGDETQDRTYWALLPTMREAA